jgi:hypothetical protein
VTAECRAAAGQDILQQDVIRMREAGTLAAAIAEHEAWKTAGRPGGTVPHEQVAAELLRAGRQRRGR